MEILMTNREGVHLFCRIEGSGGKPLLLIHGSIVDADFFTDVSALLSRLYRVISYDRRSYSRSEDTQDCSLEAQVFDAADLLRGLSEEPAIVVGCSTGALVAMRLAAQFPELVDSIFLHEPPLLCFADALKPEENAAWQKVRALAEKGEYHRALIRFLSINNDAHHERAKPYAPEQMDVHMKNGLVFMEREFLNHLFLDEAAYGIPSLQTHGSVYCLVRDSGGSGFAASAVGALAQRLGQPLYYVPGGHNAARDLPVEFAAAVAGLLALKPTEEVGDTEIALLDCTAFADKALAANFFWQMDAPRRRKILDCKNEDDSALSLGVGVLCRYILQRHGIDPAALRFTSEGRPVLDGAAAYISLSHAGIYAIAGISDEPISVDIEEQKPGWERIAAHFFSPEEQQYVRQSAEPTAEFYRLWSRKECLIKRDGLRELRDIQTLYPPDRCHFSELPLPGYSCVCCTGVAKQPRWRICQLDELDRWMRHQ